MFLLHLRFLPAAVGFCLVAAFCVPPVYADAASDARPALQSNFDQMNAATKRGDFTALYRFYAPDYAETDWGKRMTLKMLKRSIPQQRAELNNSKRRTTFDFVKTTISFCEVSASEGGIIVGITQEAQYHVSAPHGPTFVTKKSQDDVSTLWKKYGHQWRLKRQIFIGHTVWQKTGDQWTISDRLYVKRGQA